jgi:hypothetical protein
VSADFLFNALFELEREFFFANCHQRIHVYGGLCSRGFRGSK